MAKDKKSFLLYCDLIHTVSKMPKDKAGELFIHILEYVNDKNPITDDLIIQLTFEPIKQSLKRDLEKYESIRYRNSINARLRWDKDNATASDRLPNDTKNADSDNDSVSDSVTDTTIIEAEKDQKVYLEAHKEFAKKLSENELEKQAIYETTRKIVTTEYLRKFNAHLLTQSKQHNYYSEYKKHFTNWLGQLNDTTKKPKAL